MNEKRRLSKKNIRRIQHILTGLLAVMLLYIVWFEWDARQTEVKNKQLLALAGIVPVYWKSGGTASAKEIQPMEGGREQVQQKQMQKTEPEEGTSPAAADAEQERTAQRPVEYDSLIAVNPDIRGWISIPDTGLSLPVLQGKDNEFYLTHDFYGEYDRHGSIFIDCKTDVGIEQSNTVLYGHHMRDGSMFGLLENYAQEDFYRKNPFFSFDLIGEERTYQILAVVKCSLAAGENDFRYYDYKIISEEENFWQYYNSIKALSLYDIPVTASYGDELVTLCTCDYSVQDGRLLIIGKKC